jgi:hypothetical protein
VGELSRAARPKRFNGMTRRYRRLPPLLVLLALVLAVALAGCLSSVSPDEAPASAAVVQGDIEYTAETLILESFPVQLHTIVRMRNRTRSATEIRFGGGCPVQIRAYRNEARTSLAWDQGRVIACTKEIQIVTLKSGESAERNARTDARAILGDSLPDGKYYFSAYVQVVGAPFLIPAGAADLSIPRE